MTKSMKMVFLSILLLWSLSTSAFAQGSKEELEIEDSKILFEQGDLHTFWSGRNMTVFRYYSSSENAPTAIAYREYKDDCWWEGSLQRQGYPEYNGNFQLWKATFSGKIYKKECYKEDPKSQKTRKDLFPCALDLLYP